MIDSSVFQKDLSEIAASLRYGLETQLFGSFADRNPGLGPMVTCIFCHTRRRQFQAEPCCNASHSTHKRAWAPELGVHQDPCEPRVIDKLPKSFFKRLLHKRHSNTFRKQVHDMALFLQMEDARDTTLLLLEGNSFHTPQKAISVQAIPAFAERVVRSIRKHKANQKRKRQHVSRKINRGLRPGLDG